MNDLIKPESLFFVFDVEATSLHGEGFAFGYVVVNSTCRELASDFWQVDYAPSEMDDWVKTNILPALPDCNFCEDLYNLRGKFWDALTYWQKRGATVWAECGYPVEARFLESCIENTGRDISKAPYPLHEIATAMALAGIDPMATYPRRANELPVHHPTSDARQSARLLCQALATLRSRVTGEAVAHA